MATKYSQSCHRCQRSIPTTQVADAWKLIVDFTVERWTMRRESNARVIRSVEATSRLQVRVRRQTCDRWGNDTEPIQVCMLFKLSAFIQKIGRVVTQRMFRDGCSFRFGFARNYSIGTGRDIGVSNLRQRNGAGPRTTWPWP
jgi:hypothetical protein